jgi:hypothetical protein
MLDLIQQSIDAHGGLERWKSIQKVVATFTPGGLALQQRGQEAFAGRPTRATIHTGMQRVTFDPFLAPGQIGIYAPHRAAVEQADGTVLEALMGPRDSFLPGVPWSAPQLAYFVGYALWTYFNLPFALLREGIDLEEIEPWVQDGESWRAVRVTFPKSFVTHSTEQVLYFDAKGLIRRHDYSVEIAGGSKVAHYLYDHQDIGGIPFATRRRIYSCGPDGQPNKDVVVMAGDFTDIELVPVETSYENWSIDTCS